MRTALVAGHLCVDLVPGLRAVPRSAPGELSLVGPLEVLPGGSVANTGGALAALGAPVDLVADVGDDELGDLLVRLLAARGAGVAGIRRRPGCSTSYTVVVQPPGRDRSFWHHVGANAGFDGSGIDVDDAVGRGAAVLHVGYPSLLPALLRGGGTGLVALLRRARAAGLTTSLDLAVVDPASPAAREDWPALLRRVLPHVDVLSPSVDDIRSTLDPTARPDPDDMQRVARRLVDLGAAVVLLTGGATGARLCTAGAARLSDAGALLAGAAARRWRDHDGFAPGRPVAVKTTVGSGDAATAGLLCGLLAGRDPGASLDLAVRTAARWTAGLPVAPG